MLALGGIRKDCDACHGIGHIEKPIITENLVTPKGDSVPARRRGRKPKYNQEVLQVGE